MQAQYLHQIIRNNLNTLLHPLRIESVLSSDNISSISNLMSGRISSSEVNYLASSIGNIALQFNNLFEFQQSGEKFSQQTQISLQQSEDLMPSF
jgi:hypothetical protein